MYFSDFWRMILSTTVWIIWFWIQQCSSLSPLEINFLEHLEAGAKELELNLQDFLDPQDDLDDLDVLNSTQSESLLHRRIKRSTPPAQPSPISESKKTITGVAKDAIFSKDFQATNFPVSRKMF